jgi:glycosyltransferase involved in cell wall biosynthesis
MKILHMLSSPSAGGAETFVKDLVKNSTKQGMECGVVFISSAQVVGRSAEFEQRYLAELKQQNVPYWILPKGARRNFLIGRKMLKKAISEFQPDCIHSHLLAGIIYSKIFHSSVPLLYTHHTSVMTSNAFIFKGLMKLCDAQIAISQQCLTMLTPYLAKNVSQHVIYNALDEARLMLVEDNSAKKLNDSAVILAAGSIYPVKNYPLLLDAILKVKDKFVGNFQLWIAGEGDQVIMQQLQDFVEQENLSEQVTFLGNCTNVPELMQQADLFVMSSLYEGLPIALIEAQFCGLPAIVTDVGGCEEVLSLTKGGMVVPVNCAQALSESILSLLTETSLRQKLAKNAKMNSQRFSITRCLTAHKQAYQQVLSRNH